MKPGSRIGILVAAACGVLGGFLLTRALPPQAPAHAEEAVGAAAERQRLYDVARQLREGGFILHFRHAQRQKWDSVWAFDVYELAAGVYGGETSFRDAVCLTPQGVEEAKMIGEIFRLGEVPVGHVVASPSCRAQQTARLAWGRVDAISNSLAHSPVTNEANYAAFAAELRRLYESLPIAAGANTIVSGHGNTLENHPTMFASGRELLSKTLLLETGCYVIRRDADGALHVVQRFGEVGTLAANLLDLDPAAAVSPHPVPAAVAAPAGG